MRSSSRLLWRVERRKMTRTELIVQLLKIAIGLVFGAYFVWWSLQVLDRLTPEYDAPTAVRIMKDRRRAVDLAFGQHKDRTPTQLRRDARGRDDDVREELAAGGCS